jgi:hypothetical protein
MSWRNIPGAILFSPILVGCLVFVAVMIILRLPNLSCKRYRAVRYLPYVGLAYYGFLIPLALLAFGLSWWIVAAASVLVALDGDWLLPRPFTFLFNARNRRAVKRAIEYLDSKEGLPPIYGRAAVVGFEDGRTIVSVAIKSNHIPPERRHLAVADDDVMELGFDYLRRQAGFLGQR